jgi:hypothetical protein
MHTLSTPVTYYQEKGIAFQSHYVAIYFAIVVTTIYFMLEVRI